MSGNERGETTCDEETTGQTSMQTNQRISKHASKHTSKQANETDKQATTCANNKVEQSKVEQSRAEFRSRSKGQSILGAILTP